MKLFDANNLYESVYREGFDWLILSGCVWMKQGCVLS